MARRGFTAVIQQREPGTVMFGETVPIHDITQPNTDTVLASTLPYLFAPAAAHITVDSSSKKTGRFCRRAPLEAGILAP